MCKENTAEHELLKEIADLKQQIKEKDNEIAELQAKEIYCCLDSNT